MSSTSPNFSLVLASSSDVVAVDSHVANNFSTVDSVFGVAHTGTGQHKSGISFTTPILINPALSGTMSGGALVVASTGSFSTITATGGSVTVNSFSIGTYAYPGAIGSASYLLTVVTGNAQWAASSPNTGANQALSNLAAVALNTSIGTGTAGFFTFDRVISTSGAITGLTSFQATAGTFAGNVVISGTATINVVNCTGGAITGASIGIGTYSLPATLGAVGQVMVVSGATLAFQNSVAIFSLLSGTGSSVNQVSTPLTYTVLYDPAGSATATGYTTPTSGVYNVYVGGGYINCSNATQAAQLVLTIGTTAFASAFIIGGGGAATAAAPNMMVAQAVSSGVRITVSATGSGVGSFTYNNVMLCGHRIV